MYILDIHLICFTLSLNIFKGPSVSNLTGKSTLHHANSLNQTTQCRKDATNFWWTHLWTSFFSLSSVAWQHKWGVGSSQMPMEGLSINHNTWWWYMNGLLIVVMNGLLIVVIDYFIMYVTWILRWEQWKNTSRVIQSDLFWDGEFTWPFLRGVLVTNPTFGDEKVTNFFQLFALNFSGKTLWQLPLSGATNIHPGRWTAGTKKSPNWNPENHLNQTIMTSGAKC